MFKPGMIVRTPSGGRFGERPVIVLAVAPKAVTVSTGHTVLMYEPEQLTLLATVVINLKRYSNVKRIRFNRCRVDFVSGRSSVTLDVVTRPAEALGEITTALEVRKLVFEELTRRTND